MPTNHRPYYYIRIPKKVNTNFSFSKKLFHFTTECGISDPVTQEGGLSAMHFTPGIALFIFCTQFLAYAVKGLIGFGNPLISAPILSMRLDNVVITPGTLLLDCPVN